MDEIIRDTFSSSQLSEKAVQKPRLPGDTLLSPASIMLGSIYQESHGEGTQSVCLSVVRT